MNPPLPKGWIIADGYYVAPDMIAHRHADHVITTNGKTIRKTGKGQ